MMRSTQYWLGILICFWLVPHGALHAQENGSYTIRQALAIDWVTKDFNPAVKLYWATETAPEFAELSRPEVVSSSGISNNPLAGRGRCYEAFRDFNPQELHLVEALRTLRLLHYSAWIARRWEDPAFPAAFPWFNTQR